MQLQPNQNPEDPASPQVLLRRILLGRYSVVVSVAVTTLNLILFALGKEPFFVIGAVLPYYLTVFGSLLSQSLFLGAICLSALLLGLMLLFWMLSRRKPVFLSVPLGFFLLDTLALAGVNLISSLSIYAFLTEYLFHGWMLYALIGALCAARKLQAHLPKDSSPSSRHAV